jgi:hypothetical protein
LFLAWQLFRRDLDVLVLAIAPHGQVGSIARLDVGNNAGERSGIGNVLAVYSGNRIARLNPGLGCRTVIGHIGNHGACGLFQANGIGEVLRDRLDLHADITTCNLALGFQLGHDARDSFGGNVKADADAATA